jgi:cold shock CspA family protein
MICEVTFWNSEKAYGFLHCVEPGKPRIDAFGFIRNVKDKINLQKGDVVTADFVPSPMRPGRMDALNIVLRKRDETAKVAQ